MLLKIGDLDVTSWLQDQGFDVEYDVLLSDKSGRNARGNNRIEIVNRKDKLICKFNPLTADQAKQFLSAIEPYVINVTYLSPKTGELKTIRAYIGTPTIGYLRVTGTQTMMKEFALNFIEM